MKKIKPHCEIPEGVPQTAYWGYKIRLEKLSELVGRGGSRLPEGAWLFCIGHPSVVEESYQKVAGLVPWSL